MDIRKATIFLNLLNQLQRVKMKNETGNYKKYKKEKLTLKNNNKNEWKKN
jgi:hypothetical protein